MDVSSGRRSSLEPDGITRPPRCGRRPRTGTAARRVLNRVAQADVDESGSATELTSKKKKELVELRGTSDGWRWKSRSSSGRPPTSPVRMFSQTSLPAGP